MKFPLVLPLLAAAGFAAAAPSSPGKLPLAFEENRGQTDARAQYLARSRASTLFLTRSGAVLRFQDGAVAVHFRGARKAAPQGEELLTGESNYLGPRGATGVRRFGRVRYRAVWPGIDVVFHGEQGQIEYDFEVAPGADPHAIALEFEGAAHINHDDDDLVITTGRGEVRQRAPAIYQNGRRIAGGYMLRGRTARFHIAAYDPRQKLTVDPVLAYVARFGARPIQPPPPTVLGLDGAIRGGNSVAVDAAGNAYIVGSTFTADFPVTLGAYQTSLHTAGTVNPNLFPSNDAFVMKLNAAGTALVYSTFLGGSQDDQGYSIAIDPDGNAYVCGMTQSHDFPVTPGALQPADPNVLTNGYAGFVAKLNPAGNALVYSTYLGDNFGTELRALALDADRNVYLTGVTAGDNFPTTPGAFRTANPNPGSGFPRYAAFVAKLNQTGTALVYATFLGEAPPNSGFPPPPFVWSAIAVDRSGNAFVGGTTQTAEFPTTPGAFMTQIPGGRNTNIGFVTEVNPAGTGLVFSTLLGGGLFDAVDALALGPDGSVYTAGRAYSPGFPTTPGSFEPAQSPEFPVISITRYPPYGFITRLKPDGTGLIYSTFVGGGGNILMGSIAVDAQGNAFVAGSADSPSFPTTPGSIQPCLGNQNSFSNAFLLKMDPTGSRLLYSTFLGGNTRDQGFGMTLDAAGNAYVTGMSDSTNFNTTPGSAGIGDGQMFVAKIDFGKNTTLGVSCIANLASMEAGPVAAGEMVAVFGNGLGPGTPQPGSVVNGAFTTSLAGTRVLFDGVPAPLLMASANQVNAIVPSPVRLRAETSVQVEVNGKLSEAHTFDVVGSSPAIFTLNGTGAGQGAVLNQDGTVNSPSNPASRGSIVSVYANSAGFWRADIGDGLVLSDPHPSFLGTNNLRVSLVNVFPIYSGNSPGSVAALWQLNIAIPVNIPPGTLALSFVPLSAGANAQRVTISVK